MYYFCCIGPYYVAQVLLFSSNSYIGDVLLYPSLFDDNAEVLKKKKKITLIKISAAINFFYLPQRYITQNTGNTHTGEKHYGKFIREIFCK